MNKDVYILNAYTLKLKDTIKVQKFVEKTSYNNILQRLRLFSANLYTLIE